MTAIRKEYSIAQIDAAAAWVWESAKNSKVLALHGNMGAGKTTLVSAICNRLGVKKLVSSPTFSIINEYSFDDTSGEVTIYHIDLYRLKDEQEAVNAGVEDCFYSNAYCFVEWPERAPHLLPPETIHIYLYLENETNRTIEIEQNGVNL